MYAISHYEDTESRQIQKRLGTTIASRHHHMDTKKNGVGTTIRHYSRIQTMDSLVSQATAVAIDPVQTVAIHPNSTISNISNPLPDTLQINPIILSPLVDNIKEGKDIMMATLHKDKLDKAVGF